MSRAYRIKVRESLSRTIAGEDHICTQLEILQVLPADQMAELLAQELEKQGLKRDGTTLTRKSDGVTVTVDASSGEVTVRAEASENLQLETEKEGAYYDDYGQGKEKTEQQLKEAARQQLEKQEEDKKKALQQQVTDQLEGALGDVKKELDQAVNRATAEALKKKAAQLGKIKEVSGDADTGLTIVVEV